MDGPLLNGSFSMKLLHNVLRLSSRKSVCDAKFSIEKGNNKIVIDYLDLNPVPFGTHLLFEFYQHH